MKLKKACIMKPDKLQLIQNWVNKAEEALEDAQINLDNNRLTNAQNRIYYSLFYSVMALGYSKDFITSKHSELRGWFNKEFVKTGIFPKEIAKTYNNSFESRMKSDYTIVYQPEETELKKLLFESRKFIQIIKTYISLSQ